jgi:hypothetical protein
MNLRISLTVIFFFSIVISNAQVYSNKEVGKKNIEISDSLKNAEYPYALPIWGEKATKLGFNLPLSAGLSLNYLWQESDLIINNLKIGFNSGPQYDLDDIIRFNNAISTTNSVNFRPDIWLFPFLNVYGIFASTQASTNVDFTVYVPNGDGFTEVQTFNTVADFNATTAGFGVTPTIGVGGGWMALDMNFTWTDIAELEEPAFSFVFGPRLGKSFKFNKPESNIAVWVGGFRVKLNTGTNGSLPLADFIPDNDLDNKINSGLEKVDNAQVMLDDWWNNLSALEQAQNLVKYQAANTALNKANNFLISASDALNGIENSTVDYSLDKKQKNMWNFVIGSQYQVNKRWMIRGEFGFLASRTQFLGGVQYRFGL